MFSAGQCGISSQYRHDWLQQSHSKRSCQRVVQSLRWGLLDLWLWHKLRNGLSHGTGGTGVKWRVINAGVMVTLRRCARSSGWDCKQAPDLVLFGVEVMMLQRLSPDTTRANITATIDTLKSMNIDVVPQSHNLVPVPCSVKQTN